MVSGEWRVGSGEKEERFIEPTPLDGAEYLVELGMTDLG